MSDVPSLLFSKYDQSFFPDADYLVRYLQEFCDKTNIHGKFNCEVNEIDKVGDEFRVFTKSGEEFSADLVVVATGLSTSYAPDIKGLEMAEHYTSYDRSVEGRLNKDILVIGKGNSAFETAQELLAHAAHVHLVSPSALRMAWQTHFVDTFG